MGIYGPNNIPAGNMATIPTPTPAQRFEVIRKAVEKAEVLEWNVAAFNRVGSESGISRREYLDTIAELGQLYLTIRRYADNGVHELPSTVDI